MKPVLYGLLIVISLSWFPVLAAEPTNLTLAKRQLVYYHNSGEYEQEISRVVNQAIRYLKQRTKSHAYKGKPAIVLDIDETAMSNYPDLFKEDFGGTLEEKMRDRLKGEDKAIRPVHKLYEFAKAKHLAIIFLTGRFPIEQNATEANLKKAGYKTWDKLILRTRTLEKTPASIYKSAMRKALTEQGYDIVLSMGDQYSDLRGGFADKTFKLPNPFYLIP